MKGFRKVLVHVDSRADTHPVLNRAVELAQQHGSQLTIVDIVPEFSWPIRVVSSDYQEIQRLITDNKRETIDTLLAELRKRGVTAEGKVLSGKASMAIMEEVKQGGHDLVMKDAKGVGSRRPGSFGTTATRLMRFCPCTVWAYRPANSPSIERVVAAVDATPADEQHAQLNRKILEVALAIGHNGKLHVVHAWSVYGESLIKDYLKRDEFEALVEDARDQAYSKMKELLEPFGLSVDAPEIHLLHGDEDDVIAEFVNEQKFDVLVMGTVGRSGLSGLLVGNTAEMLLDRVQCSIVAVKPNPIAT